MSLLGQINSAIQKEEKKCVLIKAVASNQIEKVKKLLDAKPPDIEVNYTNEMGCNALNTAIETFNVEIVILLLNVHDIDVNIRQGGFPKTPLILAITSAKDSEEESVRNGKIVKLLCSHKEIDPNKTDVRGYTPLMHAVRLSDLNFVNILLEKSELYTLGEGLYRNHFITSLLCNKEQPCKLGNVITAFIFRFFLPKNKLDVNIERENLTALAMAMSMARDDENKLDIVKRLLEVNDIKIPSMINGEPLDVFTKKPENKEILELLQKQKTRF